MCHSSFDKKLFPLQRSPLGTLQFHDIASIFYGKKLIYMHLNPISGKWNLDDDFLKYSFSSAKFYEKNEADERLQLTHYKEFIG
jgi:hypothetical protein